MDDSCPPPWSGAVAVSREAGGADLGRALARELRAPLIDLDRLTAPLLDAPPPSPAPPDDVARARRQILGNAARDALLGAPAVVMVAPFTREFGDSPAWDELREAVAPSRLDVLRLVGPTWRGEADEEPARAGLPEPGAPDGTITIDAVLEPFQQLARALPAIGARRPLEGASPVLSNAYDACLFDLDGTLVDSIGSVVRSWLGFAEEYGVALDALHDGHGQPALTQLRRLLPEERVAEALAWVTDKEVRAASGSGPVRGAVEMFGGLPEDRRAIVTSGSIPIATARLAAVGIALPDVLVTVEDVSRGKPHPEPYLLAARRLGRDPARCLVLEDAPSGIQSAKAAGCGVIAVTGTAPLEQLGGADLIVDGLDQLRVERTAEGLRVHPA